jgi:ADP-dependent phosphofructokinase/glucokinase
MNAAEDLSICFHAMPHDPAIAVWADWRQRVDRAFEAIECVMLSGYDHFERFVIFIFANFACSHT